LNGGMFDCRVLKVVDTIDRHPGNVNLFHFSPNTTQLYNAGVSEA
jgi:hypothetical protein